MELTIKHAYSDGFVYVNDVEYFAMLYDHDRDEEQLFVEYTDGSEETFVDVEIGGGEAE